MKHKMGRRFFPMNKASPNDAIGRARGPRGFRGPVEKAKDKKGTIKRIWNYIRSIFLCSNGYSKQ